MDDVELLQLQLKQQLLKEKTKEVETKQKVETEQKPVTFENNLLSWMASKGQTPPPFYDESEVEGQVSPETFQVFQQFMNKPSSDGTSIAQKIAKSGLELAEAGKSEIVDVPDTVGIYSEGGKQLDIPPMAQTILEKIANTVITGLGYAEAGFGFTVGSIADALVKAGVSESLAYNMAKDVMAMPEAFAGSPSQLFKPNLPSVLKPTTIKKINTKTPEMNEQEIAKLIRSASGGGANADKAIEKLIAQAKINPEIKEMADRLGFKLPFDIFAEGQLVKRSAGITRDVKGSVAEAVFRQEVQDAINQADNIIKDLGATDLATISEKIGNTLQTTQQSLKVREGDLFDRVNGNSEKNIVGLVDKTEKADITNTINEINRLIKEEGTQFLDPKIKAILKTKDLKYGGLLRLKEAIGEGLKNKGPFGDTSSGQLSLLYKKILEDQFANAIRIGGDEVEDLLKTANSLTVKRKELEQTLIKILGKDLQGSIAPKLKGVITSGGKGDISNTNRILQAIPEELRTEAILTAIQDATKAKDIQGNVNFGLSQFSTLYQNLKDQKPIFTAISKELGPEITKVLDELAEISKRITEARANVDVTGKANQALLNAIQAQNVLEKFMTGNIVARAVQGGIGAVGGALSGQPVVSGLVAAFFASLKFNSKDRLGLAGELFNNVNFRKMIDEVAQTGSVSEETLSSVAKLPIYKRWAKSMGIDDGRNWLQGAVVTTAESPPSEADEALDTIVEEQSSLDQSSAAQDIIKSVTPSTIDKIRQYA